MLVLLFIAIAVMFVALIPRREPRWAPGASLRRRTDAQYETIMRATQERSPFIERDGKWYSRETGEEAVKVSLEELLESQRKKKDTS